MRISIVPLTSDKLLSKQEWFEFLWLSWNAFTRFSRGIWIYSKNLCFCTFLGIWHIQCLERASMMWYTPADLLQTSAALPASCAGELAVTGCCQCLKSTQLRGATGEVNGRESYLKLLNTRTWSLAQKLSNRKFLAYLGSTIMCLHFSYVQCVFAFGLF